MCDGIGVGASKFLGVQRIFAQISETCPKSCRATFADRFCVRPPKMVFTCFSANLGRHFWKPKNVGRHFCLYFQIFCSDFQGFCQNFQRLCQHFQGFCLDFQQIKTFGGAFAPPATPPPTPLCDVYNDTAETML